MNGTKKYPLEVSKTRKITRKAGLQSASVLGNVVAVLCLLFVFETVAQAESSSVNEVGTQGSASGGESPNSRFRAVTIARDRAVLSAEMAGKITTIPFSVGNSFQKGDILVSFDCRILEYNQIKAEKDEQGARRKWESISKLEKLSATGRINVDLAYVEYKKAEAEHNSAKTYVDRCSIRAPFDGRVIRLAVQPFENATIGQPVIEIIGSQVVEVESAVPTSVALGLRVGSKFIFKSDQSDFNLAAHIVGVAPVIDPVSQLVSVRGIFDDKNTPVVVGITGEIEFSKNP